MASIGFGKFGGPVMSEQELENIVFDAYVDFIGKYVGKYDKDDLAYYIGYIYFEKQDLRLFNDTVYDKNNRVIAKQVKCTYDMNEFKIDYLMVDPNFHIVGDVRVGRSRK